MLFSVSLGAQAAGYVATLSESTEITGYKAKQFYNFQTNTPDVLPTTGDLRYREGGVWGLHNFGSGGRSATVAIPVKAGDAVIIEPYTDQTVTINVGEQDNSIASGYTCYKIKEDADEITFSTPRYGGVVAVLVVEKDADASFADYTVKYMCGTTEVKPSTTGSGVVGSPIVLTDADKQNYYTSDGTAGYVYESDDSGSKTIAADGSTVVTVSFKEAKNIACKIKAMIGDAVADEMTYGNFEGKSCSVPYNQFILKDGRLYEADVENNEYNLHFVMDGEDKEIEYRPTSFTNVVYFSEAEDISGMHLSQSANANIRCSFGMGAYNDGEDPVYAATLPAGVYKISAQVWGNTGETLKVALGENVLACETSGSRVAYIAEFTINEETDLMIPVCGSSSKMLDWIFVQKTGDVEPAKDLYIMGSGTPYGWDNTTPMTLNAETNAYEYELTLSGMSYFAIGDAAFTDWDDFNTHRYGIGGGNTVAPIDTPTLLEKYADGTLVIETAGEYKVSVTKDMMMTITKTADVTATVDKVQIKGATDSEWSNQITVDLTEGEENVYTGVLDPAGSTNDVEFKLVVNDGSWIGYNELTLDAPDGWVVAQSGDKSNFVLKNADTGFKNYTVTATWVPNADFVANWTLKIEGKDKNATELEVPGTVIWSSEEPQTVDWNNGKSVVIPAENFASVKVGDILNIGVLGAPEGASPDNWSYQIALQEASTWKSIESGEPLKQAGDYVHSFVITGDMLKLLQANGLGLHGTVYTVKKVAVESKYSGSDESIWVGDFTISGWNWITIMQEHFANANDFAGVEAGQILRINGAPTSGANLVLKYQGKETSWAFTDFEGVDVNSCATETGYDVPVTEEMATKLKANRLLIQGDGGVQVTSVELVDAPAVEPEVVDITVVPAGGSDIYEAYAAKVKEVTDAGNVVGNITINLGGGDFTISNTIVASKNITIERKSGPSCTIDASGLSGNMIEMVVVENPEEWTKADVKIAGIMVKGLQKALFYSAGKNYVAENFTINDCVIEQAADASTIDYTKGSTALNLTITNSTFFAPTATTKSFYSSQSGQRPTDYDASATQTFTFKNNTMYNLAYGKNFFTNRSNGQKWMIFDIEQNIFVNCGKSGQVVKGFNGGQASANPTWTVSGNLFNYDGADTSASESTADEAEPIQDSVEGIIVFTDPTAPDFSGTVLQSSPATVPTLGDPRWTLTYGKALAINITESEGGKITASPSAAAEGMTVTLTATPDEGYELESLTVKDGADAEVTVGEDNTFTMPATDVTVTATFKKLPVDVNITVESGNDIAAAVETAADGAPIKSINVTLEEGGTYTIGKSLSAQGNVIINGNGATIDASALTTPFVQMADLPTEGLNDKGAYEIDEVSFNDVTITGLPYQLFYANKQKYLITTLKVDNSVIGINGSKNKTIFDFNSGGNCLNLTVNNSTLWANPSNAQNGGFYSSQSGQSVQDLKDGAEQVTTISNSTIYNIASGKTTSTRRKNSQDWIKYVVTNSIIAESGKSGQFLKGLNAGQAGKDAEWTVDGNTFIFGGAVIEEQNVGSSAENIQNSLTSDPEFADAANGDFTVGESTEQAELETGDPRWLTEYAGGEGDATDLLAEIEEAKKLLKYSMPYYDENNEESPEAEGKALVDAIRDAEEKAEGGTSQKKLDKMLEELKQAEIDYTTALMDYELAESEDILAGADPADELAAEIQRLYDTQDVVREDYSNQPKHIKNYADEIDKAQKAYLRKAINELIPEAQAVADNPAVQNALDKANEALEGDSSEDLFDALNGLLEAMETATGIRGIEANDTDDAPVYNMGGQRVSSHAKGIVIKNGKKIIRK